METVFPSQAHLVFLSGFTTNVLWIRAQVAVQITNQNAQINVNIHKGWIPLPQRNQL
jgi:hypothetical protein